MALEPQTKSLVVGITGKYCSGKNAVSLTMERRGFFVIDVDRVGHSVLNSLQPEIVRYFGNVISAPDGRIDRAALGSIVFSDPEKLELLESIMHPVMVEQVRATLLSKKSDRYAINAAILYKMGLHVFCDMVFWVRAPLMMRITRATSRDGISASAALKRIWAQRKLSLQSLPSTVDSYTVRNRGNLPELEGAVEALLSSKGIR